MKLSASSSFGYLVSPHDTPFTFQVKFRVAIHNRRGASELSSLDEKRIGEAYLDGDITVKGDLVAALDLSAGLTDRHPLVYIWSTYGQRLLFGQVNRDKQWIREHYDSDSDFYLFFLDKRHRCYSHGYFEDDDVPLERAIGRKLDTAIEACGIRLGWRVLDIGAGWGAFTEHAGKRGVRVTSLTISAESERYVNDLIARESLPCRLADLKRLTVAPPEASPVPRKPGRPEAPSPFLLRSECPGEVGAGADQVGVEVVEPLKLRDLEFANSIPLTKGSP